MPFVSGKDRREFQQTMMPFEYVPEISFGEVYAASVGMVIDEELSISSSLNREGWSERNAQVEQLIATDQVDRSVYETINSSPRTGRKNIGTMFDYDRLATERPELGIKTNKALSEERNKLLEQRRNYAEDVIERGSGVAQFLGMASGYMLDPVNIATIGVATAPTALKSLSVMGRALMVARNEAALNLAAELAIQPLVYGHKTEIGSPYSAQDAINNIGFAALSGGALGGAVGGIGGYINKVRKAADSLDEITPDVEKALEYLARMEETLKGNPYTDLDAAKKIELDYIEELRTELIGQAGEKLSRGQRKALTSELDALKKQLEGVEDVAEPVVKKRGTPARKAKADAAKAGAKIADAERAAISERISILTRQLNSDAAATAAEADLSRLEQGILSDQAKETLNKLKAEQVVNADIKYLKELNDKKLASAAPTKVPDDYVEPPQPKPPAAKSTARVREILEMMGLKSDFDADMAAYDRIDNPIIMDGEDIMDGKAFMKELDDEVEGIESVLVCAYG